MKLIRFADLSWSEVPGLPGGSAEMADATGAEQSAGVATGFVRFDGARITRRLAYDEVVHVLSGTMEVHVDGEVSVGRAGDCFFLPRGLTPTCVWPEPTEIFFAIHPANWRELIETPLATA
jgi:ethanolamine utilization protein EutQ